MPPPPAAPPPPYVTTISTLYTASEAADFQSVKTLLATRGIVVRLLPDGISSTGEPDTSLDIDIVPSSYREAYTNVDPNDNPNNIPIKVISFTKPTFVVTIQSKYVNVPNTTVLNLNGASAYGEGTRKTDTGKNTTIQYHESRHGQSFLKFIKNNPFPVFTGKIGMTPDEFKAACDKFEKEKDEYKDKEETNNINAVDCVGEKTIDQYRHTNQCSAISVPNPKP